MDGEAFLERWMLRLYMKLSTYASTSSQVSHLPQRPLMAMSGTPSLEMIPLTTATAAMLPLNAWNSLHLSLTLALGWDGDAPELVVVQG